MSEFTVLGIDPGKHTGYAVIHFTYSTYASERYVPLGFPPQWTLNIKQLGTIEYDEAVIKLNQIISALPKDGTVHVAVEKFVMTRTAMIGQATQALEVTGMVQAVLGLAGVPHTYDLQKPGDVKTIYPLAKLKEVNVLGYRHGHTDHAIDGLRHALFRGMRTIRG